MKFKPICISQSTTAIIAPRITVETITTADCLNRVVLSSHVIFLNSPFSSWVQLFLRAVDFSSLLPLNQSSFTGPELFCFLVYCMLLAESAVLLCFHSVWMRFLILCHIVITLFTILTCQCYFNAHFHLPPLLILRHKKKTSFIAHLTITQVYSASQEIFFCF